MDYVFGVILAVCVMSLAWPFCSRSGEGCHFFSEILIGVLYFIAFGIGGVIAGALLPTLLAICKAGSTWLGVMIADGSVASAVAAAKVQYETIGKKNFSFGVGSDILWGWTLCFLAFGFRILSGRWPHQLKK